MFDIVQPSGDMSDPPVPQLVLSRVETPGMHLRTDFGAGRVEERSRFKSFALIPPNVATQIYVYCPHQIGILAIEPTTVSDALNDQINGDPSRLDFGCLHRGTFMSPAINAVWDAVLATSLNDEDNRPLFADSAVQQIVRLLARQSAQLREHPQGGLAPWQIRRVIEAIEEINPAILSLAELAQLTGLSPFHFCRAFKQSLGVAPHHYQSIRRMERARDQLENTSQPVTEIALSLGYGSSQAFARAFSRHFGQNPTNFRRQRQS